MPEEPLRKGVAQVKAHHRRDTLDLNGDGRIVKGELALAALSVGRFLPAPARTTRVKTGKSNLLVKKDQPPARRTRSIVCLRKQSVKKAKMARSLSPLSGAPKAHLFVKNPWAFHQPSEKVDWLA